MHQLLGRNGMGLKNIRYNLNTAIPLLFIFILFLFQI